MYIQSVAKLIEINVGDIHQSQQASGSILSAEEFNKTENFKTLEKIHKGLFAFLVFHPRTDNHYSEYLSQGTIAADAGPSIMVMFALEGYYNSPKKFSGNEFDAWLKVDESSYPMYEMVRTLPFTHAGYTFPGILLIEKFSEEKEAFYIPVENNSETSKNIRNHLNLASQIYASKSIFNKFQKRLSLYFIKNDIKYYKTLRSGLSEWFMKTYIHIKNNFGDIVSVLSLAK